MNKVEQIAIVDTVRPLLDYLDISNFEITEGLPGAPPVHTGFTINSSDYLIRCSNSLHAFVNEHSGETQSGTLLIVSNKETGADGKFFFASAKGKLLNMDELLALISRWMSYILEEVKKNYIKTVVEEWLPEQDSNLRPSA